ncbi:uncharacterized protein F5147DRAFT_692821 [Suillus discolor]|uniref:Secreted protein n=1 Tax=Suillus discolor TaxID=1912936 RepID=A0A9P7JUP1_9AGAM|nr:uncharacterized protein F5147DRAFT_692821 [Suillus discolor]KAG2109330.1 hypothetical protein F5147DRAFT_692821 [Suillus discolor]
MVISPQFCTFSFTLTIVLAVLAKSDRSCRVHTLKGGGGNCEPAGGGAGLFPSAILKYELSDCRSLTATPRGSTHTSVSWTVSI